MKLKLLVAALDSEQHHRRALQHKVQTVEKKLQFRPT
jgi:hypothetical protein